MRGLGSGVKCERVHVTSGNLSALSPPSQFWGAAGDPGAQTSLATLLEMIDISFSNELGFVLFVLF